MDDFHLQDKALRPACSVVLAQLQCRRHLVPFSCVTIWLAHVQERWIEKTKRSNTKNRFNKEKKSTVHALHRCHWTEVNGCFLKKIPRLRSIPRPSFHSIGTPKLSARFSLYSACVVRCMLIRDGWLGDLIGSPVTNILGRADQLISHATIVVRRTIICRLRADLVIVTTRVSSYRISLLASSVYDRVYLSMCVPVHVCSCPCVFLPTCVPVHVCSCPSTTALQSGSLVHIWAASTSLNTDTTQLTADMEWWQR
uniref:(California timema) hypothetical protein n=1 Tax=Timema californicum TaxID=61474 RepID=A0A7R9J7X5_TIMCA|nr:unnamed protein product [Timema californicum]